MSGHDDQSFGNGWLARRLNVLVAWITDGLARLAQFFGGRR